MDRAALLTRCEDAYQGIRDARSLNAIISAVERAEWALDALILALEPDVPCLDPHVRFVDLSRGAEHAAGGKSARPRRD